MKNPITILAAAFAAACQAMPKAFDLAGAMLSIGCGSLGGTWTDQLIALVKKFGGLECAKLARFLLYATPWFLGFLVLFFLSNKLPGRWRKSLLILIWLIWITVVTAGIWQGWHAWREGINDPRLLSPIELMGRIQDYSQRIFINSSALPLVAAWHPHLVDRTITQETRSRLAQSPTHWREEDRKLPFSAVLLSGRLSEAKPLILHLLASPDWHLAAVDNQGVLFMRGDKPDHFEKESPAWKSPQDRALYLAQYALCLDAAQLKNQATLRMEEAIKIAGNHFDTLICAASLAASRNQWEQVRKLATKAQGKRPGNFEADYLLASSLLEIQSFDKAYQITSQLIRNHPSNPSLLLLHARTSRTSKNFAAETAALEQLLRLAGEDKMTSTRIHIYLGQSWAQRGFPDQALSHYKLALAGDLAPAEVSSIQEVIQAIETNRPASSP